MELLLKVDTNRLSPLLLFYISIDYWSAFLKDEKLCVKKKNGKEKDTKDKISVKEREITGERLW